VTLECGRVDDVVQFGPAPWAISAWFADTNHRADERCEDTGDDNGYSKNCAENCAAKHPADNEAHGSYDQAEQEPAEDMLYGWPFGFVRGDRLVLNHCSAGGAEDPRSGQLSAAFLTLVGHGMALPVDVDSSARTICGDRTAITPLGREKQARRLF